MRWSGVNVFLIGDNQDQRTVRCSLSEAGSMRFYRENRVAGVRNRNECGRQSE